jgi:protein-S-isoprenylcysteine O-methyltransferase Ste14
MALKMSYVVLAGLWIIWCALHSGMIWVTVTDSLKRRLGSYFRFYRLFFNLTAIVTVIPVILYGRSLHTPVIFRWEGVMIILQFFLFTMGILLFLAGARHYDMLQFLGLRQIRTGASHGTLTATGGLHTTGVLRITRHPWYLGAIVLLWAGDLNISTMIGNIILTLYLIVGTVLEERKLVREFGEDYRRYQKQISMLFPFKYLMLKVRRFAQALKRKSHSGELRL